MIPLFPTQRVCQLAYLRFELYSGFSCSLVRVRWYHYLYCVALCSSGPGHIYMGSEMCLLLVILLL